MEFKLRPGIRSSKFFRFLGFIRASFRHSELQEEDGIWSGFESEQC
jgi:hypothetical protein